MSSQNVVEDFCGDVGATHLREHIVQLKFVIHLCFLLVLDNDYESVVFHFTCKNLAIVERSYAEIPVCVVLRAMKLIVTTSEETNGNMSVKFFNKIFQMHLDSPFSEVFDDIDKCRTSTVEPVAHGSSGTPSVLSFRTPDVTRSAVENSVGFFLAEMSSGGKSFKFSLGSFVMRH